MTTEQRLVEREFLLAMWKIHILHHALKAEVWGQFMLEELLEHGYHVSPGTLYPILKRMEKNGWLSAVKTKSKNPKSRRPLRITAAGREVLKGLREQIRELHREVVLEHKDHHHHGHAS